MKGKTKTEKKFTISTILKWIGIFTAVISLILGVRQVVNIVRESAEKKSRASELQNEARQLALSGLYSKAWESISQAAELDDDLREAQVEIAMEWLRNVRLSPGQKEKSFIEIVNKVSPALHAALDTTRREYAATVHAHIGYAAYLLFKEGERGVKPENHFRSALRLDSTNVFANAIYGFWILYPGHGDQSIEEANRLFSAAVRSGKERTYVRSLMYAAFMNASGAAYLAQLIGMANDMQKNNETMEREQRMKILSDAYWFERETIMQEVAKVLSPQEHLKTFLYLSEGIDVEKNRYYKVALDTLQKIGR